MANQQYQYVRLTLARNRRLALPVPFITEEIQEIDEPEFPEANSRVHLFGVYWDVVETYDEIAQLVKQTHKE